MREAGSAGETEKFATGDRSGAAAVGPGGEMIQAVAVAAEERFFSQGVLKAGQVGGQRRRSGRGEGIDAPRPALFGRNHAMPAEIGEVARDLCLRQLQHGLEVADTQRTVGKQVDDAEARDITKAIVEPKQFQRWERKRLKSYTPRQI